MIGTKSGPGLVGVPSIDAERARAWEAQEAIRSAALAGLVDAITPPRPSRWTTDAGCWPRCETGTSILMYDATTRAMRLIEVTRDRLKDCVDCRARRWARRQGRWLRHLWVEDDDMWAERIPHLRFALPPRPGQLWVGWSIPAPSGVKMRETRNAREKARGTLIDYFNVTFDDGSLFVVASEDVSPRERHLAPYPPPIAWDLLEVAFTSETVRRHKGRAMSPAWSVPPWFQPGPKGAPGRLVRALRRAGVEGWVLPTGMAWPTVVEAVDAILSAEGSDAAGEAA